jgi:hypothetical protein
LVDVIELCVTAHKGARAHHTGGLSLREITALITASTVCEGTLKVKVLINKTITIIVDLVTLLKGPCARHAAVLTAVFSLSVHIIPPRLTALDLTLALSTARGGVVELTGLATRPAVLNVGHQVKSLIDRAITIIVELITTDLIIFIPFRIHTGPCAHITARSYAGTYTLLSARELVWREIGERFINQAVAVIVTPITPLTRALIREGVALITIKAEAVGAHAVAVTILVGAGGTLTRAWHTLPKALPLALYLYTTKLRGTALIALTTLTTVGAKAHLHTEILWIIAIIIDLTRLTELMLIRSTEQ